MLADTIADIDPESSTPTANKTQLDTKGNKKGLLWFISIFSVSSQDSFLQYFSVYAREVGVSAKILGFLMSIRNLLTGLFQGSIGRLSDKIGRKYILIFGFFFSAIIPIPLVFYQNTYLLIAISIIQAFSISIIIPTWNGLLGDVTEPNFRATFIGRLASIGRMVSVMISLMVAGVYFIFEIRFNNLITIGGVVREITWQVQYGTAFIVSAFNALLCLICVFFIKETHKVTEEKKNNIPKMWIALKDKSFVKFLIANSIFGITMSMIWPTNPIIFTDVLDLGFPEVAVITSSFAIFTSLSTIIGGKICDKIGRKPLIVISAFILVFFPISMVPALTTNNWWILIFSRFVGGLGTGLNFVAINSYTLDVAPGELMGAFSGMREMFYGFTTFIGSFTAGFIIDALSTKYDYNTVVMIMCVGVTIIRLIAAFGYIFIKESLPSKNGTLI
ncbi:MAG: MFS transporter [Asgard group archaeon]|nr:MFS transporter [Asgard group archaeon]